MTTFPSLNNWVLVIYIEMEKARRESVWSWKDQELSFDEVKFETIR